MEGREGDDVSQGLWGDNVNVNMVKTYFDKVDDKGCDEVYERDSANLSPMTNF